MSTYYLLDQFHTTSNPPNPLIYDVASNDIGQVDATGAIVMRVPPGVPIDGQPRNLTELSVAISAGLVAKYAGSGFTRVVYDPCLSVDRVNVASSTGVLIASNGRSNNCIVTTGGSLVTNKFSLDFAPSSYAVIWVPYAATILDPVSGRTTRRYDDRDPSVLTCQVTFDGKSPATVSSGVVQQPGASATANAVTLQFTSLTSARVYLGSWAIVYK